MSSRQQIVQAIRDNLRKADVEKVMLPDVPAFTDTACDLQALFKKRLEVAAGSWYEVASLAEAREMVEKKFPDHGSVVSATPEWQGTRDLASLQRPHELEDCDLGVVRAEFGVAEIGAVWLTEHSLQVNALGFLPQHLVVLLDPVEITENMHTAYQRVDLAAQKYGCFMMGPSATADIGATLVHGAQGVRSLTLFFLPPVSK